jgi:hypothetical protein
MAITVRSNTLRTTGILNQVRVLLEGSAKDWLGRSGKLLLFAAGLVALIDVIGPDRFRRWSDSAATRRDLARDQMRDLMVGRPLMRLAVKMIHRVTAGHYRKIVPFSSPWFTAAEFDEFARRAREKLKNKGLPVSLSQAAKAVIYDEAYKFLSPHLTQEQQRAFRREGPTFRAAERTWRIGVRVLIGATVVFFLFSFILSVPTSFILMGSSFLATLFLLFDFVSPPFLKVVLYAHEIRIRLIRVPLMLIGPKKDGWRLRVAALIAFVVGSSLDLIASW